jgi:threonine dehydratase
MIPSPWLKEASARLAPYLIETPLTYDRQEDLYLKWENRQRTGSFKVRGAINKVLTLEPWECERGLVAVSAGNHGQGVTLAASLVGAPVVVFASEHAVPAKVEAMRNLGAEVRLTPGGYGEAEQAGLKYAAENRLTWVSPYNDGQVIAGQGTLALETLRQLAAMPSPPVGVLHWIVPVGGGGLCAGIACAIKNGGESVLNYPGIQSHRLVGVQSEASPFFHAIFHHGSQTGQVELPSLADGLSGPVEEVSVTIPILRRCLDDLVLVSENAIRESIIFAWQKYGERIEGAAAAPLAAVLAGGVTERPALVIISGGNIQPELHQQLISTRQPEPQTGDKP